MSGSWKEPIEVYRRTFQERLKRQQEAREEIRQRVLQAVSKKLPAVAARYPSVQRVYLFGSTIQPHAFHEKSDVDIAVEGTTAEAYFAFWRELEQALPDWVIDLREITTSSSLAERVYRTGLLIYERAGPSSSS